MNFHNLNMCVAKSTPQIKKQNTANTQKATAASFPSHALPSVTTILVSYSIEQGMLELCKNRII